MSSFRSIVNAVSFFLYYIIVNPIIKFVTNYNIKTSKNKVEFSFYHNNVLYKVMLPVKDNPKFILITNEKHLDVTDVITPYLGPSYDFFGLSYTPRDFGYKELSFDIDDKEILYKTDDVITINQPVL